MTLVALRHLPTEWNRTGKLQGRADTPIGELTPGQLEAIQHNRAQLDALGPFEAVFCSTLRRTTQTAVAYGFPKAQRDPLLDEFDFGIYEGKARTEMLAGVGEQWLHAPHTLELGEKMTSLETRIRAFLARESHRDRVLIFGHGCWLRGLLSIRQQGDMAATNRVTLVENQMLQFDFPSA
jgi:probable phosphoglycerate mutase